MLFNFNNFRLAHSILLLFIVMMIAACNKENNTTHKDTGNTMPVSITHTESYGTAKLILTYNNDSTLRSINATGYEFGPNLTFSYKPNTILIEGHLPSYNNNGIFSIDSVTLNTSGRITNVRKFNADKTQWTNDQYTLNASNEIIQLENGVSTSQKTGKHPYTYSNGNLIHDATAALYLYDLTKPAQFGDFNSLQQFLNYGVKYNLSKNLVTGGVYGTDTTFYKYSFDKAGRITDVHLVQKGKTLTSYQIAY